jgi:hypothetical protein
MCDPDHFRTVICMTAIAVPQNPANTPTLGRGSRDWRNTKVQIRHLAAILLAALAAAFFVSALIGSPPAPTQRYTPAVEHPSPPSSEQILSRLHHNDLASEHGGPRPPIVGR